MKITPNILATALAAVFCLSPAKAQAELLTPADQAQLAAWLGEGPLALTTVFSKTPGATAADFHAAADGKGRTFSVMEARNDAGQSWLVGGYNPQSWSSKGGFNLTPDESARTAFVFNLSASTKYGQLPDQSEGEDFGAFQTLNDAAYGPVFGAGFDLGVPHNLSSGGTSSILSYVSPTGKNPYTSILDGSPYLLSPNVTYGAIEVYTIAAVPEPATWGMLAVGVAMIAWMRRRRGAAAKQGAASITCGVGRLFCR